MGVKGNIWDTLYFVCSGKASSLIEDWNGCQTLFFAPARLDVANSGEMTSEMSI